MLHFERSEYDKRVKAAKDSVVDSGLDGVLMFAPESHYWLTGYDTFGFALFQCLVLTASGDVHLLTRAPDLRQAQQTSTLSNDQIHIWKDVEGVNPATNHA